MVTVIQPCSTEQHIGNYNSFYAPEILNYPSTPNKYDHLQWSSTTFIPSTTPYRPYPFQLSPYDMLHYRFPRYSKDYSEPLFVDCSIEYELPNAFKIPQNSDPILMIHPDYQSESLRVKTSLKEDIGTRGLLEENSLSRGMKRSFKQMSSNEEMNGDRGRIETRQSPSSNNCCCSCHNSMFLKRVRFQDNIKMPPTEGFLEYGQRLAHIW
ncbi:unnamed protein product [Lepeophtheirus salmonis]|uniref:(salmon louse) hypothetical protein n=1 Tax=Lepeophtheirus salmonis TaxID=72036 RepID=A0A0K2TPU4_LEPSM|nr:unnamed protein product [Lepeophtheirus salmonis]CAG9476417.1 unnamed protein product [Lepeophtheirus salmonis]